MGPSYLGLRPSLAQAASQHRMPKASGSVDSVVFLAATRMENAWRNGGLDLKGREQSAIGKFNPPFLRAVPTLHGTNPHIFLDAAKR